MEWFKFYGKDWLTDIKIISMSLEDKMCFITILCLASQNEGIIKNCEEEAILSLTHLHDDPYNTENEYTRGQGILKRLNDNGMITIDNNNTVTVTNFMKRQSRVLTGYERLKRYREKQKEVENKEDIKDDNAMITIDNANDNARQDKTRQDKTRQDKKIKTATKVADSTKKKKNIPMTKDEFIESCRKSPRRYVNIVAEYVDEKKSINFITKDQWSVFLKRNLRPAKQLEPFTDNQLSEAMNDIEKADYITKWTLETLLKYIEK